MTAPEVHGLTANQRRLYETFARNFGRPLPVDRLIDAAWGHDPNGGPNNAPMAVRAAMRALRRKIAPHGLVIANATGRGNTERWLTWAS